MAERLRRELDRWGFSDTEIEVYLAILEIGEGPASEVAQLADVSARHVYRVCERLEERGLVDVDDHVQPTRVRARQPSVVQTAMNESTATVTEALQSLYTRPPEESTEIEVLKRQPTVLARIEEIVAEATDWAIVVAPPDVVERIEDALAGAIDRDTLVFLLTDVDALSTEHPLGDLATIIKTRDGPMGFQEVGVGADYSRSLMVSPTARMGDEHRYTPALFLDDETIGPRNNLTLFGNEWRLAEEHLVSDPVELPFSSTLLRETLLHAATHRRRGTALRARVDGRSVEDGRTLTVDGAVVEIRQEFLEPYNQSFNSERTLVLETDDGRVTVGGPQATMEDVAADEVTLYAAEDDAD